MRLELLWLQPLFLCGSSRPLLAKQVAHGRPVSALSTVFCTWLNIYPGNYRSYANGVGNSLVPVMQGFFTRVSAGQTSG